jgi:hypothetical protein
VREEEFLEKHCPPLPEDFEPQQGEPKAIESLLTRSRFRMNARYEVDHRREMKRLVILSLLVCATLLHAAEKKPEIVVNKAVYGVQRDKARRLDLTKKIQKQVASGKFNIEASNAAAGSDPAGGTVKTLSLEYTVDGKSRKMSITEGMFFNVATGKKSGGSSLSSRPKLQPKDGVSMPGLSAERPLSKESAEAQLEYEWLMQANGTPTADRIKDEIIWARELVERISKIKKAPKLKDELAELDKLAAKVEGCKDAKKLYLDVRRVKREIAFKNPLIDFDKMLITDNPGPAGREPAHEARHRNGFMSKNGGRLQVLEGLHPGAALRDLVPAEEAGAFWRPDLSFDGKKVLFCMKPKDEYAFHLYEVNADGTGLKQLTFGDYDDLDPIYLPEGKIMFSSGRCNTYIRCMPYTQSFVLARCDPDGKNIYLISRNSETDYVPTLMNDGKIVYSRWEYTDKGLWRIQSLWQCNPDGRGVLTFWGNQSVWPDHLTEPRAIPDSRKIMFTGLGHHQWFNGCIGIINPDEGLNYPNGLYKVTQNLKWPEVGDGPGDPDLPVEYHGYGCYEAYKTPYPLSEDDFLVSARIGRSGKFALYLADVYGNMELIYRGNHNVWHTMPFKARKAPPIVPDLVEWPGTGEDYKPAKNGTLYTANVLEGVPELTMDEVAYLRVVEMDHKTYSTWTKTVQHDGPAVSVFQAETVKRILGTVPVEKDGSVCFELPAGKGVYFQLLDKDYRAVQTMRSFTGVMPGEVRGCVGCHEMQNRTPIQGVAGGGIALRKRAAKLTPPAWGRETIGYDRFVQPILDKNCGGCHQGDKNAKAKQALDMTWRHSNMRWRSRSGSRPKDASPFPEPYLTLIGGAQGWGRANAKDADGIPTPPLSGCFVVEGYGATDPAGLATLKPKVCFTWKSKLYDNATSGTHHKVKIDEASRRRLVAWIDANGPYLGREEINNMYDPKYEHPDNVPVRPRVRTAPVIDRFNIRQDGDSEAVAGRAPVLAE